MRYAARSSAGIAGLSCRAARISDQRRWSNGFKVSAHTGALDNITRHCASDELDEALEKKAVTVTAAGVAATPSTVRKMLALPIARPFTTPELETVATGSLFEVHCTARP